MTQALRSAALRVAHTLHRARPAPSAAQAEVPLRAELFSADQMQRHGQALAQAHRLQAGRGRAQLLQRLEANAQVLQQSCDLLMESVRLGLVENLRRIAARVTHSMLDRNRASNWADQILHVAAHDPKSMILVISDMARQVPPWGAPLWLNWCAACRATARRWHCR